MECTSLGTILDQLRTHAGERPDVVVYTCLKDDGLHDQITFAELDRRARIVAARISRSAQPGDRALLLYPHGLEFIIAFLGCLYAGVIAVPAYPPKRNRSMQRLNSIALDCQPRITLTNNDVAGNLERQTTTGNPFGQCMIVDHSQHSDESHWTAPEVRPDQIAFLQYTSGSTGNPKGTMVTHGNLVANEVAIQQGFQYSTDTIMVSWLPLFHDMGLIGGVLQPLFVGFPSVLMSPASFLREPIRWLKAISDFRATTTGAPNFAYDHCADQISEAEKRTLDLSSLTVAYNGAEPVRAGTLDRFAKEFAVCGFQRNAFFPCYGLAEVTLFAAGGPPLREPVVLTVDADCLEDHRVVLSDNKTLSRTLVSSGQVAENTAIRIVQPDTQLPLADCSVGEIWISGDSVATGYWNHAEATRQTFVTATFNGDDESWLRTGDLGFFCESELFITGRLKDMLIVRGRNLYPQDIESAVQQIFEWIAPNSCAAFSAESSSTEQLAIVIECDRHFYRDIRQAQSTDAQDGRCASRVPAIDSHLVRLRAKLAEEFEITPSHVAFVKPGTFPRTSSGKVQRHACRTGLADGTLEIVYEWTTRPQTVCTSATTEAAGATESAVIAAPVAISGVNDFVESLIDITNAWLKSHVEYQDIRVHAETQLSSLGLDSLATASLAAEFEKTTGKIISNDLVFEFPTIRQLAEHIAKHAPSKATSASNAIADGSVNARCDKTDGSDFLDYFAARNYRTDSFRTRSRYFFETPIEKQGGNYVNVDGRQMLMMASYSYLGLIGADDVNNAAIEAVKRNGTGAHGVRLLAGTTTDHHRLERELAEFMKADEAIVYNSGYMTNLATVSALVQKGDLVVGDELNHASIVDGCRLSEATFVTFRHNHIAELEQILSSSTARRKLVVVDAVYSMDGDIAPLPEIIRICRAHNAMLMVDEAHSLGVLGKTGRGIQEHFDLPADAIDIKMGTLSKSIASCGGFVAGRREIIDFLKHSARGFIFSAALPAAQVGAARHCLHIMQHEPERTEKLQQLAKRFANELRQAGLKVPPTESAIVPIIFSSEDETLEAVHFCRERGLFVVPVFYPAVPMDAPRIRATVMATLSDEELSNAVQIFKEFAQSRQPTTNNQQPTTNNQQPTTQWPAYLNSRNDRINTLRQAGGYFYDTPIDACDGAWVIVDGQRMLMLASYNYLGFISDERVLRAAQNSLTTYGIGQHGSRLISGTTVEHKALERELATLTECDDAIVFNSGYVTNLATVAALIGPGDVVIGDELNHACIVDGCKLSSGEFQTFRHNDLHALEQRLVECSPRRTLVVVDAVYSMEGDIAPIPEISALCRRYGAWLMVDEAHSLGTLGATGRGILEHFSLPADAIDIRMGTLSKSFGACGGFIAASQATISFLRHNARGYVFSAAMPSVQVAAVRQAVRLLLDEPERVVRLRNISKQFRFLLTDAGFQIYGQETQIVPIACESEIQAIRFTQRCRELGLFVVPIIYPAVPMNAPRVRTNLTTMHTDDDIQLAVELLTKAGQELGLLKNEQ